MSLGVVIKGPEGVVLAADSRVTLEAGRPGERPIAVNFDNASKFLSFSTEEHKYVAAVTYGAAVIKNRTAHSYIPEFEQKILLKEKRLYVQKYAEKMSAFYLDRWKEYMPNKYRGPNMTFIVGGYDPGEAYGKVFLFEIPNNAEPEEKNPDEFGMTWGGQLQIASRIIHGYDPVLMHITKNVLKLNDEQIAKLADEFKKKIQFPIPYEVLPLQDCVDLAIFLVRSTSSIQRLAVGIRGVGGPIDVATITRTEGIRFIQKKEIKGE